MSDGNFLSAEVAAALIRVTPRRLQQLVAEGWIKKEGRGQYTIRGVVHGYLDFRDSEDRRTAKSASASRVQDARAQEIEIRMAERKRELIPIQEATAALDHVVGTIRSEMTALPAMVTRDITLRRKIEEELDGALSRVAAALRTSADALEAGGDVFAAAPEADA